MVFQDGDLILLALNKTQYNLLLIYKALAFLGESIPTVFLAEQIDSGLRSLQTGSSLI